jgi:hypothetical protein
MKESQKISIVIKTEKGEKIATVSIEASGDFTIKEYIRSIRSLLKSVKKNAFKIALDNEYKSVDINEVDDEN